VRKNVLGEFQEFTLNYEGNSFGGIWFSDFLGFYSGFHVGTLRRGDT
jgi:hypothetical protein